MIRGRYFFQVLQSIWWTDATIIMSGFPGEAADRTGVGGTTSTTSITDAPPNGTLSSQPPAADAGVAPMIPAVGTSNSGIHSNQLPKSSAADAAANQQNVSGQGNAVDAATAPELPPSDDHNTVNKDMAARTAFLNLGRLGIYCDSNEAARRIERNPDNPKMDYVFPTRNHSVVRIVFQSVLDRDKAVQDKLRIGSIVAAPELPFWAASSPSKKLTPLRLNNVPAELDEKFVVDLLLRNKITPMTAEHRTTIPGCKFAKDGGRSFRVETDIDFEIPGHLYIEPPGMKSRWAKLIYPGMGVWCGFCKQKGHPTKKCDSPYSAAVRSTGANSVPLGRRNRLISSASSAMAPQDNEDSNSQPNLHAKSAPAHAEQTHSEQPTPPLKPKCLLDLEAANPGTTPYDQYLERRRPENNFFKYKHAVTFWSRHPKNSTFSNFEPAPFEVDDKQYPCVEQFYYHHLALMCGKPELAQYVLTLEFGADIKAACSKLSIRRGDRRTRDAFNLMWIANLAKYQQNEGPKTELLSTVGKRLVEVSTGFSVWSSGVKLHEVARITDEASWPRGCVNMLGDLLTMLRFHLVNMHENSAAANTAYLNRTLEQIGARDRSTSRKRAFEDDNPDAKRQNNDGAESEDGSEKDAFATPPD